MRTIRCDAKYADVVERLAETAHGSDGYEQKIFATYKSLMMFSGALGFEIDTKNGVSQARDFVEGRVIERDNQCLDIIYLTALAETQDPLLLKDENESRVADIWEAYVNGGLDIISTWLNSRQEDAYGCEALLGGMGEQGLLPTNKVGSNDEPAF